VRGTIGGDVRRQYCVPANRFKAVENEVQLAYDRTAIRQSGCDRQVSFGAVLRPVSPYLRNLHASARKVQQGRARPAGLPPSVRPFHDPPGLPVALPRQLVRHSVSLDFSHRDWDRRRDCSAITAF
jgi:hypothetical protein